MSVLYIFPSFICQKKCDFDIDTICDHLYDIKKLNPDSFGYSSKKGWHSPYIHSDEKITFLLSGLLPNVKSLLDELGLSINSINIHTMWAMINSKGSYNQSHVHGMCNLCGVLYLRTPPNSGRIIFENTLDDAIGLFEKAVCPEFAGIYPSYYIEPEPNQLILFHPNQRHSVEISESSEDRISIAFNATIL